MYLLTYDERERERERERKREIEMREVFDIHQFIEDK